MTGSAAAATGLLTVPYRECRAALHGLGLTGHSQIQVPPHFTGITGQQMLDLVAAQDFGGVLAK